MLPADRWQRGKQERLPVSRLHDMDGYRNIAGRLWIALLLCCAVMGIGCARCRLPRIDPSGERIFLPSEGSDSQRCCLHPGACHGCFLLRCLPGHQRAIVPPPALAQAAPAQPAPPVTPFIPAPSPPPASAPPPVQPPIAIAPAVPTPVQPGPALTVPVMAGPVSPLVGPGLHVTPREVVAPVGSEVVLIAGICGPQGGLLPGERVEWTLAQGGVGHLVAVGDEDRFYLLRHRDRRPRKVSNTFAVGITSNRASTVTRGTPDPIDDHLVQRGQTWITVASAMEGTSYVTALAPQLTAWDQRQATARIHWIDARWVFPPSLDQAVGQPTPLTTILSRNSDGTPIRGWRVRYEIIGGAPAQLSPDGAQVVDVPTDATGRARVDLLQTDARLGQTHVGVQVIRPPLAGQTDAQPLLLGSGTTTVSWTAALAAPPVASMPTRPATPAPTIPTTPAPTTPVQSATMITMRMFGPDRANPGTTATYRIELTNPAGTAIRGLVVEAPLPPGWGYVGGSPAAQPSDGKLRWNVTEIGPAQTTNVEVAVRVAGSGLMRFCATVRTGDGRVVESCAATTVVAPAIDIKLTGPQRADVGANVRFEIVITNLGDAPVEALVLTDTFDEGLKHLVATSPIERAIGSLPAGGSTTVPLNFQVTRAGRLCHHAVVTGPGGLKVTADACLEATQSPPAGQAALKVTKKGPRQRRAGEIAEFKIVITNTGNVPLTNVRVSDSYERPLEPTDATAGFTVTEEELSWVFPRMEPGAVEEIRVRCRCLAAARRACNRVIAMSDQGPTIAEEACVEILPPLAPPANPPATPPDRAATPPDSPPAESPSPPPATEPSSPTPSTSQPEPPSEPPRLRLTIADLSDPVRVGEKVTYQIRVHNDGPTKAGPLTVVITFPANLNPARVGTVSPAPSYHVEGQTVRFDAVAEIVAGDTLGYRVPFIAMQAGDAVVRAELTVNRLDKSVVIEEKTEVLE